MRLALLSSPTSREADLQRQLDLALAQLRILVRLAAGLRLVFTDTDRLIIAEHAKAVGWKAARALLVVAGLSTVRKWFRRLWFVGERSLRLVLNEYDDHYHRDRHHQGISHDIIEPWPEVNLSEGRLVRRKRLGGLLSYYYRESAQCGFTDGFELFDHTGTMNWESRSLRTG